MDMELLNEIEKLSSSIDRTKKELIKKIEAELENEIEISTPKICVGLKNINEIGKTFFPSIVFKNWNKEKILEKELLSFYLNASYSDIIKIIEDNKKYEGYFIDKEKNKYKFEYRLEHNKSYIQKENEIKEFFYNNDLICNSIFNPYSRKVFDVVIINNIDNIKTDIEEVHLGLLQDKYQIEQNIIPVWNVEIIENEIIPFSIIPIELDILYCIEKNLENDDTLYKSKEGEIHHITKDIKENKIKIYFEREISNWDKCWIKNCTEDEKKNIYENDFEKYSLKGFRHKTRFEIEKILKNICEKLDIIFTGFILKEKIQMKKIPKYIKSFSYLENVKNEFLNSKDKKKIYLAFEKKEDILFEDKVNFLTAYISYIYPEIEWEGVYE